MSDVSVNTLGAAGDAQTVFDVSTSTGSGVVMSDSGPWTIDDVGKVCFVTHGGGAVHALGTITGFTDAGEITLSTNATGGITNGQMVWGTTNDTEFFTDAFDTASAGASDLYPNGRMQGQAGRVTMDAGGYIVSGRIYNATSVGSVPSLVGAGMNKSVIFVTPDINTNPGGGGFLMQGQGVGAEIGGFAIDCANVLYSSSQDLVRFIDLSEYHVHDFAIYRVGIDTLNTSILTLTGCSYGKVERVFVQNGPGGDRSYAANLALHYGVQDCFFSNHYRNLYWGSGQGRNPTSSPSYWIGGGIDECGDPLNRSLTVAPGSGLNMQNAVVFGRLQLLEDAVAYLSNCNIGKYTSPDAGPAFTIAAGATMVASMTTFRNTAGAKSVNLGTIVDAGGNNILDCTNLVCTPSSWADGVSGNQPLSR